MIPSSRSPALWEFLCGWTSFCRLNARTVVEIEVDLPFLPESLKTPTIAEVKQTFGTV